ncbi:MAG: DMT family transporter [Methylovulum sp.]|uniref:DMT family transporter n=1 Tax=Methylovulum sp. TaxID=1916980 RepID=UPI0026026022|nr:DMT family transporter [Methylovulum sp.]MDD2722860.1 DMT family transporter [Methylovulum sp.]
MKNLPAARGALLALLAALLFGASTPLVQRAGIGVGAWMTAAMLYSGAAMTGLLLRSGATQEAALRRRHWPRLLLMALCGAVIGPAALAWGLQHTGGMGASLMLTLEAVFTVLLSCVFYREHIDRRVGLAIALLTLGGGLLVFDQAGNGSPQVIGMLAVMGATVSWGMDNTLSRALADLDPGRVVLAKAAVGAACSFVAAAVSGETDLPLSAGAGLFLVGATGYGLSLRFYLLAQRMLGAARTGSVFATAPFIGAVIAFGLGERVLSPWLLGGAALMVTGVMLHILERHEHKHRHDALGHEHAHAHDDGHHTHIHATMPVGTHNHRHTHQPVSHSHAHTPDLHHTHKH